MKKLQTACVVSVCAVMAACASSPEAIEPAYVSDLQYRGLTCDQIQLEYVRVTQALYRAEHQQRQARTGDTVGWLLIGLPVGSLSGQGVESQVAELKGQQETLERIAIVNNCTTLPVIERPNLHNADPVQT